MARRTYASRIVADLPSLSCFPSRALSGEGAGHASFYCRYLPTPPEPRHKAVVGNSTFEAFRLDNLHRVAGPAGSLRSSRCGGGGGGRQAVQGGRRGAAAASGKPSPPSGPRGSECRSGRRSIVTPPRPVPALEAKKVCICRGPAGWESRQRDDSQGGWRRGRPLCSFARIETDDRVSASDEKSKH
jgi:hypothetical protein